MSLRHLASLDELWKGFVEAKASALEELEWSKCNARYAQEEAKIEAWKNHQKAKAEAKMKKLEMKEERKRSQIAQKITKKMAVADKRAQEMHKSAHAQGKNHNISCIAYLPSSLARCKCFLCTHIF